MVRKIKNGDYVPEKGTHNAQAAGQRMCPGNS